MTKVAIVGTGALGARHLQALAHLGGQMWVDLVDPVPVARERAVALLAEAGGVKGEVRQYGCIGELTSPPDLAIVATNARDRLEAVQQLCALGCPALILEKVLFTRREEYPLAEDAIRKAGAKAWVNCVRRAAPRFHRLQELIAGRPISYRVEGYNWGLACNVIHHLDEWLSLASASKATLSGDFEPEIISTRRSGYFEVLGCLTGTTGLSSFSALSLSGQGDGPPGDRTISISCEDLTLTIGQVSQNLGIQCKGHLLFNEPYPAVLQSESTAWHVAAILAGGEPSLPRYEESAKLHLAMLDVLMPHFQSLDPCLTECPIT